VTRIGVRLSHSEPTEVGGVGPVSHDALLDFERGAVNRVRGPFARVDLTFFEIFAEKAGAGRAAFRLHHRVHARGGRVRRVVHCARRCRVPAGCTALRRLLRTARRARGVRRRLLSGARRARRSRSGRNLHLSATPISAGGRGLHRPARRVATPHQNRGGKHRSMPLGLSVKRATHHE
jgi:hypothetical protein